MTELTEADAAALRWGDARVYGYFWDPASDTSNLVLVVQPANAGCLVLDARWVKRFEIDVNYRGEFYPLLTWATTFQPGDSLKWRVLFDFASDGSLQFECEELYLRPFALMSAV